MVQTMCQSNIICKMYASYKLTYHVDHHGTRGCHVIPRYSCIWGSLEYFQEESRSSKTLSQFKVEEVKTLTLDDYRSMLNTKTLGGEGVPLYVIVFCSIIENNNWEWEIREYNEVG
jgi:hypothetical protein